MRTMNPAPIVCLQCFAWPLSICGKGMVGVVIGGGYEQLGHDPLVQDQTRQREGLIQSLHDEGENGLNMHVG